MYETNVLLIGHNGQIRRENERINHVGPMTCRTFWRKPLNIQAKHCWQVHRYT